jgi:hypothetical protein
MALLVIWRIGIDVSMFNAGLVEGLLLGDDDGMIMI